MTRLLYGLGRACARWRCGARALARDGRGACDLRPRSRLGHHQQRDPAWRRKPSATDLLSDRFPSQAYGSNPLVVATDSGKLTDSKYSKAIKFVGERPEEDAARDGRRQPAERRRIRCAQQEQADRLHIGGAGRRPGARHRRGERGARRRKPGEEGGLRWRSAATSARSSPSRTPVPATRSGSRPRW